MPLFKHTTIVFVLGRKHTTTPSLSTLMSSLIDAIDLSLHTKLAAKGFLATISSMVRGVVSLIDNSTFGGGEQSFPLGPGWDQFAHDMALVRRFVTITARATDLAMLQ